MGLVQRALFFLPISALALSLSWTISSTQVHTPTQHVHLGARARCLCFLSLCLSGACTLPHTSHQGALKSCAPPCHALNFLCPPCAPNDLIVDCVFNLVEYCLLLFELFPQSKQLQWKCWRFNVFELRKQSRTGETILVPCSGLFPQLKRQHFNVVPALCILKRWRLN